MTRISLPSAQNSAEWAWSSWMQQFHTEGYFVLRNFFAHKQILALQEEIDAIMQGSATLDYQQLWMQKDTHSGRYEDLEWGENGFRGPGLDYRKIEGLEADAVFHDFITAPFFVELCRQVYGTRLPIGVFRTMFMNKAAGQGTWLPWHQDRWTQLNQDPLLTVWIPLDPATIENGCVQILPGSHQQGLINPEHPSGFLTPEQSESCLASREVCYLELEPGDLAVLHNHLLHASDVNHTTQHRRALSVCYLDGKTCNLENPQKTYPPLFYT